MENREGKSRDSKGVRCLGTGVASSFSVPSEGRAAEWRGGDEAWEADVRREELEGLERILGGDVGHKENGVLAKKSAVRERESAGISRGVACWFGGGVGKSANGLEKKAAVLDT